MARGHEKPSGALAKVSQCSDMIVKFFFSALCEFRNNTFCVLCARPSESLLVDMDAEAGEDLT